MLISPQILLATLPPFHGNVKVIKWKQTTSNIVRDVMQAHSDYTEQYDLIAGYFDSRDLVGLEHELFNFCKSYLHYNVESNKWQTTRSPAGIIALGGTSIGVDCKHYAGFMGGILDALNRRGWPIDWCYRFASYDRDDTPGHVFIVIFDGSTEVWIDPVLSSLNLRNPYPNFIKDKIPKKMLVRISGIPTKQRLGASTQQVQAAASTVEKIAPALNSVVPGAGTAVEFIAAIGSDVAAIIGKNALPLGTDTMWLVQLYDFYVLGKGTVLSDHLANPADAPATYTWFTVVLGVPVAARTWFDALKGVVSGTAKSLGQTYDQRAAAYLKIVTPLYGSTAPSYQEVLNAVAISDSLIYVPIAGSWAMQPPAAGVVSSYAAALAAANETAAAAGLPSVTSILPQGSSGAIVAWLQANPVLAIVGAAGVGFLIYELTKKKK